MVFQKIGSKEIRAAGMSGPRHETHFCRHGAVGRFSLHRAAGIVGIPSPLLYAARRCVHMAAQSALVGLSSFFSKLSKWSDRNCSAIFDVNLALGLLHDFFPARMPGIGRGGSIVGIEGSSLRELISDRARNLS